MWRASNDNPAKAPANDAEKVKAYEDLIQEAFTKGTKLIGKIKSGPDKKGLYRVFVEGHGDLVVPSQVEEDLKKDDEVLVIEGKFIYEHLSHELKIVIEEYDFDGIQWSEIGGLSAQIEKIKQIIEGPINNKQLYEDFNMNPLKGILLYGPPGTGKTLIAKAVASYILADKTVTKDNFIYIKGAELLNKYVGESEAKIRAIFDKARKHSVATNAPCIVFIDEAEAIMPKRGSRISSDVEKTIVPTFLAEMDGLNKDNPFIILATNIPESLDEAIVRPGRIDLHIPINRPNKEETKEIFDIYYAKTLCIDKVEDLSNASTNLLFAEEHLINDVSGASIKNIVQQVTLTALTRFSNSQENKGILTADVESTFNLL